MSHRDQLIETVGDLLLAQAKCDSDGYYKRNNNKNNIDHLIYKIDDLQVVLTDYMNTLQSIREQNTYETKTSETI